VAHGVVVTGWAVGRSWCRRGGRGRTCDLYDRKLSGWHRQEFDLPNNAASSIAKRRMTECLWCNFKVRRVEVA
jgi:hypothetical protein